MVLLQSACLEQLDQKTETKNPPFHYLKNLLWVYYGSPLQLEAQLAWTFTACHVLYQICRRPSDSRLYSMWKALKPWSECVKIDVGICELTPDSKVDGANMGPIWGQQDPGGPHVGPINLAIRDCHWPARQRCMESRCSTQPDAANIIEWDAAP